MDMGACGNYFFSPFWEKHLQVRLHGIALPTEDLAAFVNQDKGGDPHYIVGLGNGAILIEKNSVGEIITGRKAHHPLPRLVDVDIYDFKTLSCICVVEGLEMGNLLAAVVTPGCTEDEKHRFFPPVIV